MTKTDPEPAVCPPGYEMILQADVNKFPTCPLATISDLPHEIVELVVKCIREDRQFKSLTSLARVNRYYYDLIIPTLYETVVVNEANRRKVFYGHRGVLSDLDFVPKPFTRKDTAMALTRRLIVDDIPETYSRPRFTEVKEIRLGSRCFEVKEGKNEDEDSYQYSNDSDDDDSDVSCYDPHRASNVLKYFLYMGLTSIPATPIHVIFQIGPSHDWLDLKSLLRQLQPALPFIFEFHVAIIDDTDRDALRVASDNGGIIQYHSNTRDHDEVAQAIAGQFNSFFLRHTEGGIMYLRDISKMVLTPEEYRDASGNASKIAKNKVFDRILVWNPDILPEMRWTVFDSKVKFVALGFMPSCQERLARRNRRVDPGCLAKYQWMTVED